MKLAILERRKVTLVQVLHILKDNERLWITISKMQQLQWNGPIPWKVQTTLLNSLKLPQENK